MLPLLAASQLFVRERAELPCRIWWHPKARPLHTQRGVLARPLSPLGLCGYNAVEVSTADTVHARWWQVDGGVLRLKTPRALEEAELALFTSQRDHELRRVAALLASLRCDAAEQCAAATTKAVRWSPVESNGTRGETH